MEVACFLLGPLVLGPFPLRKAQSPGWSMWASGMQHQ